MGKSQRLSEAQLRSAFRLVGEVCELGADPVAWRAHLVAGVGGLVDAPRGFCDEERVTPQIETSAWLGVAAEGLDAKALAGFAAYMAEGGFHVHPLFPTIQPIATKPWTMTRRQLFPDDRRWYRDRIVQTYKRAADMDECIHSRQPIPRPGWSHMLAVFRRWEDRPFSERDRRLVHLVHEEVARLWWRPTPMDPIEELPPQQRRVVRHLRRGASEKATAVELGLTPQTVHAYVKLLHRRYGVASRHELLARLAPPPAPWRPRLSYEVAEAGLAARAGDVEDYEESVPSPGTPEEG